MSNKDIATLFLEYAASGRVNEAYEQFVHKGFRHHNAYFKGDRESLLSAMEESTAQFPKKKLEILRTLEDGEFVAVHGKVKLTQEGPWIALIHIFRFSENKIIEEWEVAQESPAESPNANGMF